MPYDYHRRCLERMDQMRHLNAGIETFLTVESHHA